MNPPLRRALRWLGATLLILWLLARLTLLVLDRSELRINPSTGEASAEAALGGLRCRKEVTGAFPFVTLTCKPVGAAPIKNPTESSSDLPR